jgi:hypothetical protein
MRLRFGVVLLVAFPLAAAGCQQSAGPEARPSKGRGGKPAASSLFKPKPAPVVVPAGTELEVKLETSLSSEGSRTGDLVIGHLSRDVRVGERVVLREGTELRGRVGAAVESNRVKGRARLSFAFDRIVLDGREREVALGGIDITAADSHKRDAAIIGGGTAGGAIIGAIANGKKGAAIGGVLGGAAGTGARSPEGGRGVVATADRIAASRCEASRGRTFARRDRGLLMWLVLTLRPGAASVSPAPAHRRRFHATPPRELARRPAVHPRWRGVATRQRGGRACRPACAA